MSIDWIDPFVRSIAPHVYLRERDSLLILIPNQAYRINPTGLLLLRETLDGASIHDVIAKRNPSLLESEQVLADIHAFFCDVRALVMGCLGDGAGRVAVDTVPFERPFNTLPVLSEVALTYRCNLSCRFCYAGCQCQKRPDMQEMTTEQVKRVLKIIWEDAQTPSVSWTGGEPTLRDDLVELTEAARTTGLRVNLITNGTCLTDALVGDLVQAGLRSAQVSLEGPDASVHDALTQTSGSFDRTLKGLEWLLKHGVHVHTNTTANRMNIGHLTRIVTLARSIGLTRVSMNMVIPCGSAPDEDVTLSYSEMATILPEIQQAADAEGIRFLWYSPTPYCVFNPIAERLGGKACAACDGLLSVAPNGDVLPCSSLPKPVGNLLRTPFERVWQSRKARWWRDKRYAHAQCRRCELFTACAGACPIYWDAMGYDELTDRAAREVTHGPNT